MAYSSIQGDWIYRSYVNTLKEVGDDPQAALSLIFGEGQMTLTVKRENLLIGVLDFGQGAAMDLYGEIVDGSGVQPDILIITGTGRTGTSTDKWVYQYKGYVVPPWAEGVDQVPAIVGTVIRTIPHGTGAAGVVASFVMLQKKPAKRQA
jgi:hypothetical protein